MPLDPLDELRLKSWSFVADYRKRRPELLALAAKAYERTEALIGGKPTPDDCEIIFEVMLSKSQVFQGMLARKPHLSPIFYKSMSLALARYVLHNLWRQIVSF